MILLLEDFFFPRFAGRKIPSLDSITILLGTYNNYDTLRGRLIDNNLEI